MRDRHTFSRPRSSPARRTDGQHSTPSRPRTSGRAREAGGGQNLARVLSSYLVLEFFRCWFPVWWPGFSLGRFGDGLMGEVSDLRLERAKREDDNTKVSVGELLALVSATVAAGETDGVPVRVVIIVETEKRDGTHGVESYRAGCTRYEEIALVRLHEAKQIDDWLAG